MIINENGTSFLGEALDNFFTSVYRGANPFIDDEGNFHKDLTAFYRDWNPFITSTGELGVESILGIKSIHDIPIISGIMDAGVDIGWVQSWELMESPFFRTAVPLAIATGISFLSAGILTELAPSLACMAVNVGGQATTVGTLFGSFVGATVGTEIAQIPVQTYIQKVQEMEAKNQISEFEKQKNELLELEKLVDEKNRLQIEEARKQVERAEAEAKAKQSGAVKGTVLAVAGSVLGIALMNTMGG